MTTLTTTTTSSKATKIIYWTTVAVLGLFILPGIFFMNSPMATTSIHHLGIPKWLATEVGIGSFIGGLIIVLPVWKRLKEWGYVGLGIVYLSALIAHLSLDGINADTITAVALFGVTLLSYIYYHKMVDGTN